MRRDYMFEAREKESKAKSIPLYFGRPSTVPPNSPYAECDIDGVTLSHGHYELLASQKLVTAGELLLVYINSICCLKH